MLERICVGIAGFGEMGRNHARIWKNIPGAELVAIAEPDSKRYLEAAEQYPQCAIVETIEEMLTNVVPLDIVIVATQAPFHYSHTLLAIRRGCHVICEKPMALSIME